MSIGPISGITTSSMPGSSENSIGIGNTSSCSILYFRGSGKERIERLVGNGRELKRYTFLFPPTANQLQLKSSQLCSAWRSSGVTRGRVSFFGVTPSVVAPGDSNLKWPYIKLFLSSFDFTVAVFHLHYYGKQRPVK